ncbi:hypothetical protein GCM10007931_25300 [Vibrio algivorus]|uniref:Uncharacterized protein n=1 Tax=Vibrio algivorus TaxID=1667024 RepID=A0ABQ6ESF1_9VIBR|nr:hypothetical protein GCM10007931_25300 [Vibrio algivorus]
MKGGFCIFIDDQVSGYKCTLEYLAYTCKSSGVCEQFYLDLMNNLFQSISFSETTTLKLFGYKKGQPKLPFVIDKFLT